MSGGVIFGGNQTALGRGPFFFAPILHCLPRFSESIRRGTILRRGGSGCMYCRTLVDGLTSPSPAWRLRRGPGELRGSGTGGPHSECRAHRPPSVLGFGPMEPPWCTGISVVLFNPLQQVLPTSLSLGRYCYNPRLGRQTPHHHYGSPCPPDSLPCLLHVGIVVPSHTSSPKRLSSLR